MTTPELIGYDVSPDMHNLRVVCAECATEEDETSPALYDGDEWAECTGDSHMCIRCGRALSLTLIEG